MAAKVKTLIIITIICILFGYCVANLDLDPQVRKDKQTVLIERLIKAVKGDWGR